MAITEASAVLDTGWAEFSTISTLAGTLSTLSNCIDEVGVKLKRGTLSATSVPSDADVARWITRAKEELAETKHFTFARRYMTATLTAGTSRYSLPPDYRGGLSIRDITDDKRIPVVANDIFDKFFPDMSEVQNGRILLATIRGLEIQFGPAPDGNNVIEIDYMRSGSDVTDNDLSWLPEIERFRCCDFAVREGFRSLHMWKEAEVYGNEWDRGLMKARRADGKKKWTSLNYQGRSVFSG